MKILDLFCCAGGAGMGYHQAGFAVVGVDIVEQPNYPFEFHQADAIEFVKEHGHEFDAIHASPPCQAYSLLNAYNHKVYPDLVEETRKALVATGLPYVIENVPQAPLLDPVILCGAMFGLQVYRHRGFETSFPLFPLLAPPHPKHTARCIRNGYLPTPEAPFMSIHGGKHSKAWQRKAAEVMGVPWTTSINEVCESIPPAYTRYIGKELLAGPAERVGQLTLQLDDAA
ncbi:DNA cytosine methyltransferase [Saccharopolyspora taberi]|uniref:DNA (cytosine-5-)-methyltransferase n=1 Tax=Saccharopolyspora taberi TaxID=60895 RepID=A0ABN3V1D6_9PSEU